MLNNLLNIETYSIYEVYIIRVDTLFLLFDFQIIKIKMLTSKYRYLKSLLGTNRLLGLSEYIVQSSNKSDV